MTTASRQTSFFLTLLLIVGLIILSKTVGASLITNNWSFTQWQYLPNWWPILISAFAAVGIALCWKQSSVVTAPLDTKWSPLILAIILLAAAVYFCFDSFLYGGGNLTVAKISQAEVIIKRPYEFGAVSLASWLFYALKSFLKPDSAAMFAWQIISWLCAALSLWWGWQFSGYLTKNQSLRTLIVAAIFLGPSAALLFGFVAPEPIIVAATIGVARFGAEYLHNESTKTKAWLWVLLLVSSLLYLPCLFLFPAVRYITYPTKEKNRYATPFPLAISISAGVILLAGLYYYATRNPELAASLLFFKGKNPNSDYGLFSIRHIADMLQLLLMAAPQLLVVVYLFITKGANSKNSKLIVMLTLLSGCGIVMSWLFEPVQSIILDAPLLLAYLSPLSILIIAILCDTESQEVKTAQSKVGAFLFLSVFAFLSWFPLNRSVIASQAYVEPYLQQHDNFYRTGIYAFRDALFAAHYVGLANEWEAKLLTKSPEYIDLQGCQNLAMQNEYSEALRELFKLKTNFPYWGDPRYMIAGIQLKVGRPDLAKPELDSALMLEPYNKSYLMALYGFYRDIGAYTQALEHVHRILHYFPSDSIILSDLMIISLRAGDIPRADSLQIALKERFPKLPYPYLVEGIIAQSRNDLNRAKRAYERFIAMAPDDLDAPRIRKKLNEIILHQNQTQEQP